MAVCIGLDAHKKTCVYQAKDENNSVIGRGSIPSTPADLALLAKRYPGATVVVESSGVSEWIYDRLIELGMDAVLCHPMNIRRVLGKKSDEIDAGFLVNTYRLGVLPLSWMPPPEIRVLRQLSRSNSFLVAHRTSIKNRVHAILKRKGVSPMTEDGENIENIFARKHRKTLLALNDPEIPVLLDLIDVLNEKKKATERKIIEIADATEDIRNLMTIPGFGHLVAMAVYAEIGDATRFKSAKAVGAYFGLTPGESQSGESRVRGHITRRGSSLVRQLLNQAGWVHVTTCPKSSISRKFRRVAKKAGKKRAIVGVARMLAGVAYCLLKEKRRFTMSGSG